MKVELALSYTRFRILYAPPKLTRSGLFAAEFRTKLFASVTKVPTLDVTALVAGLAAKMAQPSKFKVPAVTLGLMTWKQSLTKTVAPALDTATAQHLFPTMETVPVPEICTPKVHCSSLSMIST